MTAHRILVKLSHPSGAPLDTAGFAAAGLPLRKLFDTGLSNTGRDASEQGGAFAAGAAAGQTTWYLADVGEGASGFGAAGPDHPWDAAHRLVQDGMGVAGGAAVLMAEPDHQQDLNPTPFRVSARFPPWMDERGIGWERSGLVCGFGAV